MTHNDRTPEWVRRTEDRAALEAVRDAVAGRSVGLAHDFLIQEGGAERVLAVLADAIPHARLMVLVSDVAHWSHQFHGLHVETTWAQRLLFSPMRFRALLPVFPLAASALRFPGCDLLVSSSSAFAKAARAPAGYHLCYCYNPMRFAYEPRPYLRGSFLPGPTRLVLSPALAMLRQWDRRTSGPTRIQRIIGISRIVQERIRRRWGRESGLVFPPVDVYRAPPREGWSPDGPFVVAARLLAYKHLDLAIEACTQLRLPLKVIGDGPDRTRLQALAGPTVQFLGRVPDAELLQVLSSAAALIMPGEEDFGIALVEAMAVGTPVIALGRGGALDTMKPGTTGLLFSEPTVSALRAAILELRDLTFDPTAIAGHAEAFSTAAFLRHLALEFLACASSRETRPDLTVQHPTAAGPIPSTATDYPSADQAVRRGATGTRDLSLSLPAADAICPVCSGSGTKWACLAGDWTYLRCRDCGHVFLTPCPTPGALASYYSHSYWYSEEALAVSVHRRYLKLVDQFAPAGSTGALSVLEHGANTGPLLAALRERGWQCAGTELGDRFRATARARGLDVRASLADWAGARFDLVVAFHVLEHLHQPIAELRTLLSMLRPTGVLLLKTPNASCIPARVFPAEWEWTSPPAHLHLFTPVSLQMAIEQAEGSVIYATSERGNAKPLLFELARAGVHRVLRGAGSGRVEAREQVRSHHWWYKVALYPAELVSLAGRPFTALLAGRNLLPELTVAVRPVLGP